MKYREYQFSKVFLGPKATRYQRIIAARNSDLKADLDKLLLQGAVRIADFPTYFVTRHGAIYSTSLRRLLKVRPGIKPGGYEFVGLRTGGHASYKMVHRLVAEAFIPNPRTLPAVNHKDGNKRNNVVGNLEWVTHSENIRHALTTGLFKTGEQHHNRKLSNAEAQEIFNDTSGSYKDIGAKYEVSAQTVCNIKRRVRAYTWIRPAEIAATQLAFAQGVFRTQAQLIREGKVKW